MWFENEGIVSINLMIKDVSIVVNISSLTLYQKDATDICVHH